MAGNKDGGKKAATTNKTKYGSDFYAKIGALGGKNGKTGGFATQVVCKKKLCRYRWGHGSHLIRQCAGAKGGRHS